MTASLTLGLSSTALAAGEKDKEVMKLHDQAMNDDYLATEFAKAEKKLKDALKKCGTDKCSPEVLGKLHVALGTVYGVGMSKLDQAKDEFTAALKANPKAALDSSLATPELTKAFADAKKAAKSSGDEEEEKPSKKAGGDEEEEEKPKKPAKKKPKKSEDEESESAGEVVTHTPPAEQAVNTPVPIYMEPTEEQPLSKVVLRYKPFGDKQYKSLEMKKMGKGFGVEIPCKDVATTGDIKYFFALTDEEGEPAGTAGSTKNPYKVTIKNEIEGDAPSLPGRKPPVQCKTGADCPPGLDVPGCPAGGSSGGKRGDKSWGSSCEASSECQAGLVCKSGTCEEGKEEGGGGGGSETFAGKRNIISIGAQFDLLLINSQDNVCSGGEAASSYVCFEQGTSSQFYGPVVDRSGTNGIQGGLGFAHVRALIGYDRQLLEKIPLTLGARLGIAFPFSPSPDNDPPKGSKIAKANGFLPVHAEARIGYAFLGNGYEHKKFRPYVFIGGGLAQVNAAVPVQACRGTGAGGKNDCKTDSPSTLTNVDAYQITGLNFVGGGVGTTYGITQNFGVAAELKLMVMLPTFGFVVAPNVGPVIAF